MNPVHRFIFSCIGCSLFLFPLTSGKKGGEICIGAHDGRDNKRIETLPEKLTDVRVLYTGPSQVVYRYKTDCVYFGMKPNM